jgi:hypothetical protein
VKQNRATVVFASETGSGPAIEQVHSVADYRLYGLDGANKVASGEWIDADDDETAIEVAKEMMDGHDCELWRGRRRIARIEHKSKR